MAQTTFKIWRLILSEPADAYTNMATDVALLRKVREPVLRLYAWRPWAISLGYHQSLKTIDWQKCRRDGVDVVRRPTGGRAVFHAEEMTYSVIIPAKHPFYNSGVNQTYQNVSAAFIQGLRNLQLPVTAISRKGLVEKMYSKEAACFARSVRYEVGIHEKKLIGSALRRYAEGILQHGSLLLGTAHERLAAYLMSRPEISAPHPIAHHAIALSQVLGYLPDFSEITKVIMDGFQAHFQIQWQNSELTREENRLKIELREAFLRDISASHGPLQQANRKFENLHEEIGD